MILESRSIIFSHDELTIALRPLLEQKGIFEEIAGDALKASLDEEGEVQVKVMAEGYDEVAPMNSREVGVAVLNHCIDKGIPLPRGSYKELALRGDHIALIVRLQTGDTEAAGAMGF
ncbi:hypothetical protein [Pseudokordiimonas caeni]|uniref:hypothetical protein n=1 Tax=Pseudokordiimonas caeni TaxID=2997908 RepID=UPI0028115733|nr:hypothetical protein [Pseudokordiimonas caeni]